MSNFDDIPISKIKNMVGYQTNIDMYKSDAKLPQTDEKINEETVPHNLVKESVTAKNNG